MLRADHARMVRVDEILQAHQSAPGYGNRYAYQKSPIKETYNTQKRPTDTAMVTAPNVLCIDSGIESPYADGARYACQKSPVKETL